MTTEKAEPDPANDMTNPAASPPKTGAAALDALFESVNRGDGPGLVVGVAQHGQLLYRRGFGLASIEHGVANTPHTRMRLASITKHFTCLAAFLLAEEGKLDIDAPADRILPELPALQGMPTLRQFMTHTSGYRCFMDMAYVSGVAKLDKGWGLAMQFRQTDVNFAPGQSQLYNNGGYELLSEAIARASGKSFEQFMLERIFKPLGMVDTQSVPNDMMIVPGIATFHAMGPDGNWQRGITPIDDNRGAGAIVTTVDDMLRWMAHLRGPGRVVGSEATWQQMLSVATLDNGQVTPYACGLNRHLYRGVEVIHHGGGLTGVGTQMVTVPAHGLDIIVMTNGAMVNPVQLGWDIIDALLGEHLVGAAVAMAMSEPYKHLFGARYHGSSGMSYGFGDAGGMLGLSFLNSPPFPILRDRGEVIGFRMEEAGLGPIEFRVADIAAGPDGSAPAELAVTDTGNLERFKLLPATGPTLAEASKPLLGRYRCHDLDADAQIAFEGEQLVLRIYGTLTGRAFAIQPYSDAAFGLTALDPMMPGFHAMSVQAPGAQVESFRVSSGRARRLQFVRQPG
jgi:CubicO group peptidase (beta-lactamase class C family)